MNSTPEPSLSTSFVLSMADYDVFSRFLEKEQNGRVDRLMRWTFPIFVGCAAAVSLFNISASWYPSMIGPYADVIFWVFVAYSGLLWRLYIRYRFRKKPEFGATVNLALEEKGVRAEGPNGEGVYFWTHITRVEEVEAYCFLFVSAKSAYIVPKRAFDSPEAAARFVNIAQSRWRDAHPLPASPPIALPR